MGWYVNSEKICPNCKKQLATEVFRNNCQEGYYLVCTGCGLHLHCNCKYWIVSNSYIDESVIGKDPKDLCAEHLIDKEKNENIFLKGSAY